MLCYCFTGTEGAGDCRNAALCNREECINDTLPCNQRRIGRFLFLIGSFPTYRPFLHHGYVHVIALFICDDTNGFLNGEIADKNFLNNALEAIGNHDFTLHHSRFLHKTDFIPCNYCIAGLLCGFKFPFLFSVQRGHLNTSADVCAAHLVHFFQWTLDTVIDGRNQPGAKLYAHRHPNGYNLFSGAKPCRFLINLNRGFISVHFDDFTDQMLIRYTNHVKHIGISHALRNDQWTGYLYDRACFHIFIHLQSFIIR